VQAFDDCTTVASIFKLLDSFEGLLDRGVIAADLERKHLDLVSGYGQDLKEVADMFRETKQDPPLNKNAAPHSGRVTWVRGLKERVAGTPSFPFLWFPFLSFAFFSFPFLSIPFISFHFLSFPFLSFPPFLSFCDQCFCYFL